MKTPKFKTIKKEEIFTDNNGNKILYPEMIRTRDYDWLKTLEHNRKIDMGSVRKLTNSVIKFGMLRPIVLIRHNFVYYKSDGQHLSVYLEEAGLPIDAYVIDIDSLECSMDVITTLNNSSRAWSLSQYITSWSNFNDQYSKLIYLKNKFRIGYSLLGALLLSSTQAKAKEAIKNGTFEERADPKRIDDLLNFVSNFQSKTGVSTTPTFTSTGLTNFIIKLGLEEYKTIENKFLKEVIKYHKEYTIPAFARKSDSEELWTRIHSSL